MSKTPSTTLQQEPVARPTLYLAIEISDTKWLLGFATPQARNPRLRTVSADDSLQVVEEIQLAREKLRLPEDCRVVVGHEVGFNGFALARDLIAGGFEVVLMPPSILDDTGGKRRRKTDQLDVKDLANILIRYDHYGEKCLFRPVDIPSVEVEDQCRLSREREVVLREIIQHRNRIRGLLRAVGKKPDWKKKRLTLLEDLEPHRKKQIERELARLELAEAQKAEIEREQRELVLGDTACARKARQLQLLKGIGPKGSFVLAFHLFWREFKNRKHLGAHLGVVPTPRQSGNQSRDGGINKRGDRRVRTMLIELAWLWLKYQPDSRITKWYYERFHGPRPRKIGIVAVARKLAVALWRFLETGEIPEGARLKVVG